MTAPKRLTIKLFIDNPEAIKDHQIVPIFQHWIQHNQVEGLLIDVVDYQHVPNGPGIILSGYEGDYAYDFGDNRLGIQYTLKQTAVFSLRETVSITLRRALQAAQQLEKEKSLAGIRINANELQVSLLDRLNFPNTADTQAQLIPEIESLVGAIYSSDLTIKAIEAATRAPLRLHISSSKFITIPELLDTLQFANENA
jgi:hypothetical protein